MATNKKGKNEAVKLVGIADRPIEIKTPEKFEFYNGRLSVGKNEYTIIGDDGKLSVDGVIDLLVDNGNVSLENNRHFTQWLDTMGVEMTPIVKKDGSIDNALLIEAIKQNPTVFGKFLNTYETELEYALGRNVNLGFDSILYKGKDYRFVDEKGNLIVDDVLGALLEESPSLFRDNEKFSKLLVNLGIEKEPIVMSDGSIDSKKLVTAIQQKPAVFSRFLKDNEKTIEKMLGRNINLSFDSLKFKGKDYQFIDSKGNLVLDDVFDALIDNGFLDISKNKKFSNLLKTWNVQLDKVFKFDGTIDKDVLLGRIKEKPEKFLDFIRIEEDRLKDILGRNFYEELRSKWKNNRFWGRIEVLPDIVIPGFVSPKPIPIPLPSTDLSESQKKLLDIKGVDKKRVQTLSELGIDSTTDMLTQCRTIEQRELLAFKMLILESKLSIESAISVKSSVVSKYYSDVTYWVKQVDLWRINSMDPDTADFLVHLGVRFVEDVKKLDVEKTYPVMQSLACNSTQYKLVTKARLAELIENSKKIKSLAQPTIAKFESSLAQSLAPIKSVLERLNRDGLKRDVNSILESLDGLKKRPSLDVLFYSLEVDEPAPEYLFATDNQLDNSIAEESVNSVEIIAKGLGFLRGLDAEMPLPRRLRGTIYFLQDDSSLPDNDEDRKKYAMNQALVELDGVVDPSVDEAEAPKPSAYTDGYGKFIIDLPDGYNLKNSITITVSKGEGSNRGVMSFVVSASDVLNGVDSDKVSRFKTLNSMVNILDEIHQCGSAGKKIKSFEDIELFDNKYDAASASANEQKIKELCEKFKEEKRTLDESSSTDIYESINELLTEPNWESKLPYYIVYKSAFLNREKENKLLPSVKFMENNGHSVYLPTDTAPSEVYNYSMLQRLVEPAISPVQDIDKPRESLKKAIDIVEFKEKLLTDPNSIPHMSSLGIGYSLNMHQAWVPDGFALGNLLYSTILAPGEEQRLIVREKQQQYTIVDQQSGTDSTAENYGASQTQLTTQAYNQAIGEMMNGGSSFDYSSSTSSKSCGGGFLGLVGGHSSKSSASGSSSSSSFQNNSYNEASRAASNFQNQIKSSSEKISQAKRLLIKSATSDESDSVSTRIIANHNHSHAMTIQYWEVMRRYRLETCIDNVDLILFVPMQMEQFLPKDQAYSLKKIDMNPDLFATRYEKLLKHYDALYNALPWKYRTGLSLVKQFGGYPDFAAEKKSYATQDISLTVKGNFLPFDELNAKLYLRNGSSIQAYSALLKPVDVPTTCESKLELLKKLRELRNKESTENNSDNNGSYTFMFKLKAGVSPDEITEVRLSYNYKSYNYELYRNPERLKELGISEENIEKFSDSNLLGRIFFKQLPEAWTESNITISQSYLKLAALTKVDIEPTNGLTYGENSDVMTCSWQSYTLTPSSYVWGQVYSELPILTVSQQQKIEETMHHIASNTMRYSQAVWNYMTSDERALMLERYTIDMDFKDIEGESADENATFDDIPLLNCIDVRRMLGFYGNCMLFPFTYPEKLAKRLGKTAYELQDALYRYHTYHFRVPTTVISLPTDGMVGEAVLGETNVSEKIDITRFWNWKDSPIDKMENIDKDYLNNTDYLADKNTNAITPLNISSAEAPTNINVPDLLKALQEREISFRDLSGLDQLKEVMNRGTEASQTALTEGMKLTQSSLENSVKAAEVVGNIVTQCMGISGTNGLKNSILDKLTSGAAAADEGSDNNNNGGGDAGNGGNGSGGNGSGSKGSGSALTADVIAALLGTVTSSSKKSDEKKAEEKKSGDK